MPARLSTGSRAWVVIHGSRPSAPQGLGGYSCGFAWTVMDIAGPVGGGAEATRGSDSRDVDTERCDPPFAARGKSLTSPRWPCMEGADAAAVSRGGYANPPVASGRCDRTRCSEHDR